jgi:DNA-binding SARP family transcriptional activator
MLQLVPESGKELAVDWIPACCRVTKLVNHGSYGTRCCAITFCVQGSYELVPGRACEAGTSRSAAVPATAIMRRSRFICLSPFHASTVWSGSLAAPKESQRAAEEPLKDGRGTVSRSGRPVEFSLLGPFEVRRAGRPVALAGAKQRALLALLALHPNEVLSAARLVDELWGDEAPDTAASALQVYVSQLRKALEPDGPPYTVLVTRPPGYMLAVGAGERDIDRFSDLVQAAREGDASAAAETLREALALWRGPPLADLAYESFAQTEAVRLEELRLEALEGRIEADLDAGRHRELVGELEALTVGHPLRERLRGQLMLALYRSGRQAEALEAYRSMRRMLSDDLGLEPSPALQDLERRILRHDRSLDLAASAAPGRRAAGQFVGREAELALLLAGLDDALAGRGRLFLVEGPEGSGKTRLADEVASRGKARGARVLWGRSWAAGDAPPHWPWVQAMRTPAKHEAAGLPALVGEPASADRFTLFDATLTHLARLAREQPLVVVLDDLHAADDESVLLLEFVAGDLAVLPVLLLALSRSETPALAGVARFATARVSLAREP